MHLLLDPVGECLASGARHSETATVDRGGESTFEHGDDLPVLPLDVGTAIALGAERRELNRVASEEVLTRDLTAARAAGKGPVGAETQRKQG